MSYHFPSNSAYRNDSRVNMPVSTDPSYLLVEDPDGRTRSVSQVADCWLIGDEGGRTLGSEERYGTFDTADDAIRSLIGDPQ